MSRYSTFKVSKFLMALVLLGTTACSEIDLGIGQETPQVSSPAQPEAATEALLTESWQVYRQQFIQSDGRVIDFESDDRTVSEGQAYAMLRAVLIDDPETFEKTLEWAESNLRRKQGDQVIDQLWGWKWGQLDNGQWGLIDPNFASDADIDAAFALIMAARRWQRPDYLELAQVKLNDLWDHSTIEVDGQRYLLPGPTTAFRNANYVYLNPSYLAPYAFRVFAEVDEEHDWLQLVDSSYQILENSADLSALKLPSDWVALNLASGNFEPVPATSNLKSQYGFDAYRVWWRVAWDKVLFDATPAEKYLKNHLNSVKSQWKDTQSVSAELDLQGQPLVDYESIAQYAMLYTGFQVTDPAIALEIYEMKIASQYQAGIWDNRSSYYSQNLIWLSLFPISQAQSLLPIQ